MPLINKLFPSAYYKRIFDIPLETLKQNNIKGLVFDIDNTLAPYNIPEPNEETVEFFKKAAGLGFSLCLLSNNTTKRVERYNKKLKICYVARANKPLTGGLKKAISLLGTDKNSTVLIGDQIFTDILCGNRAGVRAILVEPCSVGTEQWFTRIKRGAEKAIIRKYLESKALKDE